MAQSTPLRALADVTPVTFYFGVAGSANFAVFFYDADGALIPPGAGSVDLSAAFPVDSHSGPASDPTVLPRGDWYPPSPTTTALATEVVTLTFGSGFGAVTLTPSAVVSPGGGATQYAIQCSLAPKREAEIA
jgi:hypothetical protein